MHCSACKQSAPADAEHCDHCGALLRPSVDPVARRFRNAAEHPGFAAATRYTPPLQSPLLLLVPLLLLASGLFLAGMGGVGGVATCSVLVRGGRQPWYEALGMNAFCLAMAALGVAALVSGARSFAEEWRVVTASPTRRLALVVGERKLETQGAKRRLKLFYATLQAEDGTRKEYRCERATAKAMGKDDVGMAYFQGEVLVDFRRIDV